MKSPAKVLKISIMNKSFYQKSEGMVDKYLRLNRQVTEHGYTSQDIHDMAILCYDMVSLISDMRCDYSKKEAERRFKRSQRRYDVIFNCK